MEAFGRVKSCMGERLAYDTRAAWIGADGKMPTPIVCKQTVKSRTIDSRGYMRTTYTSAKDVWRDFASKTADQGRYHVRWSWNGRDTGHIITMETLKDGTRRFYDPQTGLESKFINPWMYGRSGKVSFDMKKGIFAYRVDNLQPNPLIVKGVVKKAGSALATPMASSEQLGWWIKNVTNKASGGAAPFMSEIEPYSDEIIKRLRKCKTKAQRSNLLESIALGKDATVINDNGKAFTTCYPKHRSMKGETWKNTKQMAIDLNDRGISVCFLPEYQDKISADAIVKVSGSWKLADFKFSRSVKSNTIATDLAHAFEQADSCVIKVQKADKGILCDALDYLVRNARTNKDLLVINKYGKIKTIRASDVINCRHENILRGFL